jgi:N-acetylglucosaminyldiphosphoundecaprenol N-acetyl-beta-D-mannosaminyltransferase
MIKNEYRMLKTQKMTTETDRNYATILDVKLTSTSMDGLLSKISDLLRTGHKFSLFTPNPEILIEANKDINFRKILNSASFSVPDGVGLSFASKFLYGKPLNIIPGRKLFGELLTLARRKKWTVFFLGGEGIKNVVAGPKLDKNGEPKSPQDAKIQEEVIDKINTVRPDILFVGFGAPKQEKWISKNLPKLDIGGAVAVGGTFDYLYGKTKLPPYRVEKAGLEWLWRLIHEPKRVLRIFNAVVIFPLKVFASRVS